MVDILGWKLRTKADRLECRDRGGARRSCDDVAHADWSRRCRKAQDRRGRPVPEGDLRPDQAAGAGRSAGDPLTTSRACRPTATPKGRVSATEVARSTSGRLPGSRRACRCSSIRACRSAGTWPPFPRTIWAAPAFTYYAVIRDNTTGRSIVVPPGGSSAPQISLAMNGSVHRPRNAHVRLDPPRRRRGWLVPAGAAVTSRSGSRTASTCRPARASFDVDPAGDVYLLDEAHARMLEFLAGGAAQAIPLPGLAGVKADLRVSDSSGTAYVLEVANTAAPKPLLRSYTLQGALVSSSPVADAAAAQIRLSRGHRLRVGVPVQHVGARPAGKRTNSRRPVDAVRAAVPGAPSSTATSSC